MFVTPFDFDVISGPSLPRDDRTPLREPEPRDEPQAGPPPAQSQAK